MTTEWEKLYLEMEAIAAERGKRIHELEQQLATLRELREIDSKKLAAKDAEIARLCTAFNVWSNSDVGQRSDIRLCRAFREK